LGMVSIYNSVFDSLDKKSISQRLKLPLSLNLHCRKHWGPAGVLLKGSRVIGLLVMNIKPYSTMKISTLIPISLGLLMSIIPLAGGVKTGEKAPGFTLTDTPESIWTTQGDGEWKGSVGWNDNHVSFESDQIVDNTRYGDGPLNTDDKLYNIASSESSGNANGDGCRLWLR